MGESENLGLQVYVSSLAVKLVSNRLWLLVSCKIITVLHQDISPGTLVRVLYSVRCKFTYEKPALGCGTEHRALHLDSSA